MSERVKSQGYNATTVNDSIKALALFQQNSGKLSVIITDQTMPKMTGVALIEKIREIQPEFPAIMYSGYSNKIDANSAAELNISYFNKPVNVDKL
ncbi:MAG: response regulator [Gammaproteobacteria bacterium]|nr:response regulator [Gammaproteobacteria bacterium]